MPLSMEGKKEGAESRGGGRIVTCFGDLKMGYGCCYWGIVCLPRAGRSLGAGFAATTAALVTAPASLLQNPGSAYACWNMLTWAL